MDAFRLINDARTIIPTSHDYVSLTGKRAVVVEKGKTFHVINNPRGIYIGKDGFTFAAPSARDTVRVPYGSLGKVEVY